MASSPDSKQKHLRFAGKRVLVIGGTSGIGLATSTLLVLEGAKVIAFGRSKERCDAAIEQVNGAIGGGDNTEIGSFNAQSLDIQDVHALKSVFESNTGFDHLVCTATGGKRAFGQFVTMDIDGFKGSFDKLWGYSNAIQCGVPHMNKSGTSSVVLVSGSPARKCKPGFVALSCVGGAVENLTKAIAPEIAPIRINCVSPGIIDTPMFDAKGDGKAEFLSTSTKMNPIPRPGKSEEVAKGILFVMENEFVTGSIVDVDGGAVIP